MDTKELVSKYLPIVKKNWLPLGLGLLGLMFFAYGLIGFFIDSHSASDNIVFESAAVNPSGQPNQSRIAADVEGAVVRPGVYKLTLDSRIQDVLISAGGLSGSADRKWVEKNLNLAAKLTDGAKIYIPRMGESITSITGSTSTTGSLGSVGGQININSASESELDSLPGVGPVTALKIISGRPYSLIDDLLKKKIVSSKVFGQIKEKISVY